MPGWVSNIEVFWEEPACARFLERLASFTRPILFDKRGTGLSDRVTDLPNLETRMDDLRAVMDTVGSERAAPPGVARGCRALGTLDTARAGRAPSALRRIAAKIM